MRTADAHSQTRQAAIYHLTAAVRPRPGTCRGDAPDYRMKLEGYPLEAQNGLRRSRGIELPRCTRFALMQAIRVQSSDGPERQDGTVQEAGSAVDLRWT